MSKECCSHLNETLTKLSKIRGVNVCIADDNEANRCKLNNYKCPDAKEGAPDLILTLRKRKKKLIVLIELKTHVHTNKVENLSRPITKTIASISGYVSNVPSYKVVIVVETSRIRDRMKNKIILILLIPI